EQKQDAKLESKIVPNCFNCGQSGHRATECPLEHNEERIKTNIKSWRETNPSLDKKSKPSTKQHGKPSTGKPVQLYKIGISESYSLQTEPVWRMNGYITYPSDINFQNHFNVMILCDSGSDHNFISPDLYRKINENCGLNNITIQERNQIVSLNTAVGNIASKQMIFCSLLCKIFNDNLNNIVLITDFIVFDTGEDIILGDSEILNHNIMSLRNDKIYIFIINRRNILRRN
ncbi:MAG: hypothetical protein SFU98_14520, partial [Leptospiraceae bacterium]|nr:hypothetical protein [Leptospiraceae bacterium]